MRETTPEGRILIAICSALVGLVCAVLVSASSFDGVLAELASPRRWVLLSFGVAVNFGTLSLMRQFLEAKAAAVLVTFIVLVVASLASGVRWMQVQVPVAFWLADILVMTVTFAVIAIRARQRRMMEPDVQSSFLASRLWK